MRLRVRRALRASLVFASVLAGCVEAPPPPPVEEADPMLAAMIDANDAIDGVATRWTAFVDGEPAHYWHLGGRGDASMPAYELCVDHHGACVPLEGHPLVVPFVPGEEGYSPYLQLNYVWVPAGWPGHLHSVDDVLASGLSYESTKRYVHCPIAASDAQLDLGQNITATPERAIWVRGMEVRCFDLSHGRERPLYSDRTMIVRNIYSLTRDGESASLAESRQMRDLTGDGDQVDSNNIFGVSLHDGDYTPLWRMVKVTVPADYASIDTSTSDAIADYTSASDMFEIGSDYSLAPIEGRVVDFAMTDVLFDCPLQRADGEL